MALYNVGVFYPNDLFIATAAMLVGWQDHGLQSVDCDNNVWVTIGAQPLCLMVGHATQSKQIWQIASYSTLLSLSFLIF